MTCEDVLQLLEERIAPVRLSDDFCAKYSMYDNSGIIINLGGRVDGILFSLDLSEEAANLAVELGYNLIVTHHPAIYGGVSRFDLKNKPQSRALATCIKNGISVISMHLNFDVAPEGIDYCLMRGLGGEECEIACEIAGGGYGRAYKIAPLTLDGFLKKIAENFRTERAVCHGVTRGDKVISKVASFCGAGCDDHNIAFAKAQGVDAFVSSDLKHHEIAELAESGITVVELTHYSAESYGFNRIYERLSKELGVPSSYFFDERFL